MLNYYWYWVKKNKNQLKSGSCLLKYPMCYACHRKSVVRNSRISVRPAGLDFENAIDHIHGPGCFLIKFNQRNCPQVNQWMNSHDIINKFYIIPLWTNDKVVLRHSYYSNNLVTFVCIVSYTLISLTSQYLYTLYICPATPYSGM